MEIWIARLVVEGLREKISKILKQDLTAQDLTRPGPMARRICVFPDTWISGNLDFRTSRNLKIQTSRFPETQIYEVLA